MDVSQQRLQSQEELMGDWRECYVEIAESRGVRTIEATASPQL